MQERAWPRWSTGTRSPSAGPDAHPARSIPCRPGNFPQSATAGTREEEIVSSVPGASGAILSVGALLQAAATVGRLLAAAGDPDATGHRNDGGSRPADLGGGAARAADDGGGAAGDARGTGLGGRRSR